MILLKKMKKNTDETFFYFKEVLVTFETFFKKLNYCVRNTTCYFRATLLVVPDFA